MSGELLLDYQTYLYWERHGGAPVLYRLLDDSANAVLQDALDFR